MMQPAASVAHVLAAVAVGMLAGGTLRSTAALVGGGTEAMLYAAVFLALVLGLPPHTHPPRPYRWTRAPLLFLPAALILFADPLRHMVVSGLGPVGAVVVGSGWPESALFALALLPMAATLRIALRGAGRFGPIWAALGMVATTSLAPGLALGLAAALAWAADRVPTPHRGWCPPAPESPLARGLSVALGATVIAMGWTALRGVVDPTPMGALVCLGGALLGVALGRQIAPRDAPPALAWTLVLATILIALISVGSPLTARVGSAAAAWEWGMDGRLWLSAPLAATGLLGGLAMGRAPRADRSTAWAIALGLFLGPWALGAGAGVTCLGVLGALAALSLGRVQVRMLGAAVAAVSVALTTTDSLPGPGRLGPGIYDSMRSTSQWAKALDAEARSEWMAWVPGGSVALQKTSGEGRGQDARLSIRVEVDGLDRLVPSGTAAAEELAGHLAALLSPDPSHVVVLGDTTGEVVRGLSAHPTTAVDVAVPFPGLLRTLADADPIRRKAWLDPHIHLQSTTPQRRLAVIAKAPAIVELSHTPWTHGAAPGLTRAHLEAIRRRLGPGGIYVLCTHLNWWPDGGPAALARHMTEVFPTVQIWLPPTGADSLIWVATDRALPLTRLSERMGAASSALERLGYSSAASLAGTAISGSAGVRRWGARGGTLPSPDHLGPALFARPVFHAAGLTGAGDAGRDIWDATDAEELLAALDPVLESRRMFLSLIDDASRGQIGAAFDTARALVEEHGEIGARTLEPLIDPHIKDAEEALTLAGREGPTSKAWAEARRYATTARMIAPQSPRPHVVLAEVALGQGDVPRAETHFRTALSFDPRHLRALDGLARCGRLRGNSAQVEQALRTTTRHAPRDWRTWYNLGVFLLEENRLDEALRAMESAAAQTSQEDPSALAATLIGMTKVYLAKGEAAGALVRAQRATRLNKDSGVAWYLQGRAHFEMGRYDEAERDFRRAVLTDGSLVEARGAIGQVRAIRGDYAAAAEQFRAVLRTDPGNVPARENLRRLAPHLPEEAAGRQ